MQVTYDHPDDFEFRSTPGEVKIFKDSVLWRDISLLLQAKLELYRAELENFEVNGKALARLRGAIEAYNLVLEIPDFIILTQEQKDDARERTEPTE